MATRVYFLKTTNAAVTLDVQPTAPGITSTVVQLKKSGGSVIDLGNSGNDATGTISSLNIGKSNELLNAVLVVTTVVNLVNIPKGQWDSIFANLQISYQLAGGTDGTQVFNVDTDDKMQIMKKQIIVATKAIKFSQ
ncbi:MAG: hypothetical protein JNK14_07675 [Chitinophagaceae bacterium]|nr:hypothetical protein [Chitinophagaceae bacterium]